MGMGGYIIDTYHRDFYNICIREPRILTYHRMILAELKGDMEQNNHNYFRGGPPGPLWPRRVYQCVSKT